MTHGTRRVAVVGAGVVGLATTSGLLDAGAEVRLYERDSPGMAQSIGRTRIFRLAHGDARLVELARRAERLWREWEARFRRRLVGGDGLLVTGDDTVAAWTKAMDDAGASYIVLNAEEARDRLPIARPAGSAVLLDPTAGPTRARRTVECLLAVCGRSLCLEEVREIDTHWTGCRVTTAHGSWECDEVVIVAGTETGRLAAAAETGTEIAIVHDSRFTFEVEEGYRDRALACWIDQSRHYGPGYTSYGQRVGSTDQYALAVGWDGEPDLAPDEEAALHRQKIAEYMREAYPGLRPVPVEEIRCSYAARGLRADGDGFMARRSGGVTALYGNNLFKFAPLLGRLLCRTALSGELVTELKGV